MKLAELQRMLKEHQFPSALLLFGEETFLVHRQFTTLKNSFLRHHGSDADVEQFSLLESSLEDICNALRNFSLFSNNRLFVIKDMDKLKASDQDLLISVLDKNIDKTVLVLLGGKVDKKRKFYKAIDKKGAALEFKKMYENQIPAFVKSEISNSNLSFSEEGLQTFCQRVGQSLHEIDQELQKLFLYCHGKRLIDREDVLAVVSSSRVENVFALAHAIADGARVKALKQLEHMLDDGEPPVKVLALIIRHFRQLWKIRALLDSRAPDQEITKRVKINPYFYKELKKQAVRFPEQRLNRYMPTFLETDLLLKSSNSNPKAILEGLIFTLTR